jgi:ribonuclease HI
VVNQVNGLWQAHDAELANLRDLVVHKLLPKFQRWQVVHVRRENNSEADRLANAAMDRAGQVEKPSRL